MPENHGEIHWAETWKIRRKALGQNYASYVALAFVKWALVSGAIGLILEWLAWLEGRRPFVFRYDLLGIVAGALLLGACRVLKEVVVERDVRVVGDEVQVYFRSLFKVKVHLCAMTSVKISAVEHGVTRIEFWNGKRSNPVLILGSPIEPGKVAALFARYCSAVAV